MNEQHKDILRSVVVPELHFFEIQREVFFGDSMVFSEPLFCVGPETLQTVDVDFPSSKSLAVIYTQMTVSTEHQSIVAPEPISVNDGSSTNRFDGHVQKFFCGDVRHHCGFNHPVSLENTEYRDFSSGATASLAFSPAAEIGFVHFNFATEEKLPIATGQVGQPDDRDGLVNRGVAQPHLLSNPPGRKFNLIEFDDPKPLFEGDLELIDPPTGEVMEGVSTALATVPFARDSVDFSAPTPCAKNNPIFPTCFSEE